MLGETKIDNSVKTTETTVKVNFPGQQASEKQISTEKVTEAALRVLKENRELTFYSRAAVFGISEEGTKSIPGFERTAFDFTMTTEGYLGEKYQTICFVSEQFINNFEKRASETFDNKFSKSFREPLMAIIDRGDRIFKTFERHEKVTPPNDPSFKIKEIGYRFYIGKI